MTSQTRSVLSISQLSAIYGHEKSIIGADGAVTATDLEAAAAQIILLDGQLLERPRLPLGEQRLQLLLAAGLAIADHQLDFSLALIEDIRVSIALRQAAEVPLECKDAFRKNLCILSACKKDGL